METDRVSISGPVLLRIGGILCMSWMLWAANMSWVIAGGSMHPLAAALAVVLYGLFFLYGFLTLRAELPERYAWYVATGLAIALIVRTFILTSILRTGIETDGLAISLSAAHAVVEGHNPYSMDHAGAFGQYHLSPEFNTPKIDGTVVTTVTYPALSFLLYVIPVLWGADPRWVSVLAFVLTLFVLVAISPAQLRTVTPLVLLVDPTFVNYLLGLQDIWYVPSLIGAAYFWTDLPVLAGALLGFGAAIKQEPWLAVPFFALGIYQSRRPDARRGIADTARALGAAAIAFLAPNLPFMVSDPAGWFRGVFDPFVGANVEWGSGLVALALAGNIHLDRWVFTALGALSYLAMFALVWRTWPKLQHAVWLVPGFSLFFAPRSLENYYLYLIPAALASWLGQTEAAAAFKARLTGNLLKSRALKVLAAASIALLLSGCAQPKIGVSIVRSEDSKQSSFVDRLTLQIANRTPRDVAFTYLVIVNGTKQYLWRCTDGCGAVRADDTRRVTIESPGLAAAVPAGIGASAVLVDRATGDEYVSAPVTAPDGTLHLPNARLHEPVDSAYVAPAGWDVNMLDLATGIVTYDPGDSLGTVTQTLRPGSFPQWYYQRIAAPMIPFAHPVFVPVSKNVLYQGGLSPTQYAGVSVDDGSGHTELFVWGSGARPVAYQGPGGVVIIEPAATQRYLYVDAARFAAAAHFSAPPPYTLSLVIGAYEPHSPLTVTFHGFLVDDAENRVIGPQIPPPAATPPSLEQGG